MIWQGFTVEIIRILWDHGFYRQNPLLKRIHDNWFSCWVEFRTERTMSDVDEQIESIQKEWASEDPKPTIIEHESDGSAAQELLGGPLEIKAPWK